ncbi:hypothetical protein KO489_10030 [Reinekea forsetii]|nr:hypothetical protein [Reinekea forsetii]
MKELSLNLVREVNGGKLINGGYSGHPGWATSAIKGDSKKAKKDICRGSQYVAVLSAKKAPYVSMAAGLVSIATCN